MGRQAGVLEQGEPILAFFEVGKGRLLFAMISQNKDEYSSFLISEF
jgi:hypothetical protein